VPKRVIFSILANTKPRKLFTVEERASGDLTVIVKHTEFHGEGQLEDQRIVAEHFSVHRTLKNPSLNAIKHTQVLKSGAVNETRNYSSAVKSGTRFAVIFIRRTGGMVNERYDVPANAKEVVSLGRYDPEYLQPIYALLISAPEKRFSLPPKGMNRRDYTFAHFKVTVLWQYLALSGGDTVKGGIPKTFSDEELEQAGLERASKERMALGETRSGVLDMFRQIRDKLATDYKNESAASLDRNSSEWLTYLASVDLPMYVGSGKAFSPEYMALLRVVKSRKSALEKALRA
jgi:hypothetical protein